ncbi:MAG: biotin--[acetyl-CoA-carboxylase] ligase [Candidatus Eremiobacteraeota bacterium]|nr:biotin--[acetyl-CoA-carboxylase] ligase [Candidatus Eremiobacteraeota bacterium]
MTSDGTGAISPGPVRFWGERIHYFKEVTSTNLLAKDYASRGEGHGSVIQAEAQTQGLGRRMRKWHSPPGGLWFSLILRPQSPPKGLALLFSLWIIEFLEAQFSLGLHLYWPNDIYCEGRKMGGILLEATHNGGAPLWIIAGIGININNSGAGIPAECGATSLSSHTGAVHPLRPFLEDLLVHLEWNFETALKRGFPAFRDAIEDHCPLLKNMVEIQEIKGARKVKALGIGDEGQLVIENRSKEREEIWSCERVRLLEGPTQP